MNQDNAYSKGYKVKYLLKSKKSVYLFEFNNVFWYNVVMKKKLKPSVFYIMITFFYESVVYGPSFFKFFWVVIPGPVSCRCLEPGVGCWRPHPIGT